MWWFHILVPLSLWWWACILCGSWGMWDRCNIWKCWVCGLIAGSYCITVLHIHFSIFMVSCIKGCGGEDQTPNQAQTHTLTPARRDAILKGDLPVCWPRGDVQWNSISIGSFVRFHAILPTIAALVGRSHRCKHRGLCLFGCCPGMQEILLAWYAVVTSHISSQVHSPS